MNSKDVIEALRQRHKPVFNGNAPSEIFLEELRVGTGFSNNTPGKGAEQRIDAWVLSMYPSRHWIRTSYEVKVSRSDFLLEMRKPEKRKYALLYSNEFYFAAPKGLIEKHELPAEAGLIEVDEERRTKVIVESPWRDTPQPSWRFMASVLRKVYQEVYPNLRENLE